ncbi:MAG: hypothetical protein ACMG6E_01225 [Candidatus Roizmanbacteria bacterium]
MTARSYDFKIGDIVKINIDLHEHNTYLITDLKRDRAKLKLIAPSEHRLTVRLKLLTKLYLTLIEAQEVWKLTHEHSGI